MSVVAAEVRTRFDFENRDQERAALEYLIEGTVQENVAYMRGQEDPPCCLACAGVRYEPPPRCGAMCIYADTAPIVLKRKKATCYSIAAYYAAKRRVEGHEARVKLLDVMEGKRPVPDEFHAIVELDGGADYEDPTVEVIEAGSKGGCQGDSKGLGVG